MKTCADCRYSSPFVPDLTKIVCEGVPPTPMLVPHEQVQMTKEGIQKVQGAAMNMQYPVRNANARECWFFREKEIEGETQQ